MRRPKYNTVRIQKAAMCQMRDHINETEVIEILSSDPEMNQSTPESEHLRMETIKQIHCSLPKKRNLKKTFSRKLRNSGTTLAWGPSMRFKLKQVEKLLTTPIYHGEVLNYLFHYI